MHADPIREEELRELDTVIAQIADYTTDTARVCQPRALRAAHLAFLDTLACALLALQEPAAMRTAEPLFPSAMQPPARVLGTNWTTDPVQAAFATGTLIRWQDFNDTWLAREWGHPSDNMGGLIPLADHLDRSVEDWIARQTGRDLLVAVTQAYEIQGTLALHNALNRHGLDHVALVRVATSAVATRLLGGDGRQIASAITHAWADGAALRAYRHAPNVTARKSWAAADAAARGIRLAYMALRHEPACPRVLTTPEWGFQDVLLGGEPLILDEPMGTTVVEQILLKPEFPAEYHGQTAVEAALHLHSEVAHRLDSVSRIEIRTQESAIRIIDKRGPLTNYADRDHCLQYMVAAALIFGEVTASHYSATVAVDPRLDALRALTDVQEESEYTQAYDDPDRRAVPNAVRVHFADGTHTRWQEEIYPLGHPRRRHEATPIIRDKLIAGLESLPDGSSTHERVTRLADVGWFLESTIGEIVDCATPPRPAHT